MVEKLIISLTVDEGKVIRVSGPASIEVLSGEVLVAGAVFQPSSKLVISRYRSYGVKALKRSELKVVLGDGGSLDEPQQGEEVIDSWIKLCEELINLRTDLRIIIIGPPEAGKTSLTAFIANQLLQRGREVYIVDADIGQEDIAIPCTIGVAKPKDKFIWLRELQPLMMKFVGCNSPQYCLAQFITAFQEVINDVCRPGVDLIVNTDGWVTGYNALELKQLMIRMLRPTHVLILDEELFNYFRNSFKGYGFEVLLIPRPKFIKERSREDRRYLRHHSYLKLFSNVRRVELDINKLVLINSLVLTGKELSVDELSNYVKIPDNLRSGVIYASVLANTVNIVLRKGLRLSNEEVVCGEGLELNIVNEGDEKGLLVGVLDRNLRIASVGIVERVDYLNKRIYVLTPWGDEILGLIIGRIKLNEKYEEVGRVVKCIL
ncbi:MAG: Clp1/GlmU family protein [Sulfolobales archaeon]